MDTLSNSFLGNRGQAFGSIWNESWALCEATSPKWRRRPVSTFHVLSLALALQMIPAVAFSSIRWARIYGDSVHNEVARDVCPTTDGGYVVAGEGYCSAVTPYNALWLFKLDAYGKLLWSHKWAPTGFLAGANAVTRTRNGGFAAAGYSYSMSIPASERCYILLADSLGDSLRAWSFGTEECQANDIEQTRDGGFVIAGHTLLPGGWGGGFLVARFDSAGDSLWCRTFEKDSICSQALAVKQTRDGGFVVVGDTDFNVTGGLWLVRLDANGHLLWSRILATGGDGLTGVTVLPDGGYMVVGELGELSGKGYLARTDSAGHVLWSHLYGGTSGPDFFEAVDTTSGMDIVIAGITESYGSGAYDAWIVKTDSNGVLLWSQPFGGRGWDYAWGIRATPDGGAITAGYSTSFTRADAAYVIKVDADGSAGIVGEPGSDRDLVGHFNIQVSPMVVHPGQRLHSMLLRSEGTISAALHDVCGRGIACTTWRSTDCSWHDLLVPEGTAPGSYFVVFSSGGFRAARKILVAK